MGGERGAVLGSGEQWNQYAKLYISVPLLPDPLVDGASPSGRSTAPYFLTANIRV
jgi:hypothetical protein